MNRVQKTLSLLPPYRVEQDVEGVKLNQNEAPFDVPPRCKREILHRLEKLSWRRYPPGDPSVLLRKLSDYYGVPPSGILIGNGSNELIQTILLAVCGRGGTVLTVKPGFSVYRRVASLLPTKLMEAPLGEDLAYDLSVLLRTAGLCRLVVLASPHNPAGGVLEPEEIERLADRTPGLLVLDEAYAEFRGWSAASLLRRKNNLVVLRTFSKAWRLAGARLGCLLGRPELIQTVAKARLPFSVNIFAQAAAEVLLDRRTELDRLLHRVGRERERVFRRLKTMRGISPFPSWANFILFESLRLPAGTLHRLLRSRGVETRSFDDPLLRRHLRVTIGTPAENDAFLSALSSVLEGGRR